jgi:integrase
MRARKATRVPSYRLHKATGRAVFTICGGGQRKDFFLGRYGSPKSRERYERLVAEWLAAGAPRPWSGPQREKASCTVSEVILRYLDFAETWYCKNGKPTSQLGLVKRALGYVHKLYGRSAVHGFGPQALVSCREAMIQDGFCRTTVNSHVGRIKRMFRWAVERELVPSAVFHGLQSVTGLRRGRTKAPDNAPVRAVTEEHVWTTLPHVSPQIGAMVQLQLLTGMRPTEVCQMRVRDLQMQGEVWTYRPPSHKAEHYGKERRVLLGPRAQAVVRPFLKPDLSAYLFSPREAENARRAGLCSTSTTPIT